MAWEGPAPGAGGERLRSRKRFGGGGGAASSAPGELPPTRGGEGNDLWRSLNNGRRVVFFPPGVPRILFLCRNRQPLAFCQARSVHPHFRLLALWCDRHFSSLFSKYFTASGPSCKASGRRAASGDAARDTLPSLWLGTMETHALAPLCTALTLRLWESGVPEYLICRG